MVAFPKDHFPPVWATVAVTFVQSNIQMRYSPNHSRCRIVVLYCIVVWFEISHFSAILNNLFSQPVLLLIKSTPELIFTVNTKLTLKTSNSSCSHCLLRCSHLIGQHVEEVIVHAAAVHPLCGRHCVPKLLFLGHHDPTFGHELPAQTGFLRGSAKMTSSHPQRGQKIRK